MKSSSGAKQASGSAARPGPFGPGLLVTAAFIGPGTITTASLAGAGFGYGTPSLFFKEVKEKVPEIESVAAMSNNNRSYTFSNGQKANL